MVYIVLHCINKYTVLSFVSIYSVCFVELDLTVSQLQYDIEDISAGIYHHLF